jgi:hypothetical protein
MLCRVRQHTDVSVSLLQAITEFLSSMGLSASQLAARPELVDLIVSYHFAPGEGLGSYWVVRPYKFLENV